MSRKVAVICGSVRKESLTKLAVQLIEDELLKLGCVVDIIDPKGIKTNSLGEPFSESIRNDLQKRVQNADGIILCTPEYNGCFSYVLMAIIENLGYPSALDGKVISMLGVASGQIGAIKSLEHLRSVCSHLGAVVLPWPISIAEVHKKITLNTVDEKTSELVRTVPKGLLNYIKKFKPNTCES